jgi:hypothetical protein
MNLEKPLYLIASALCFGIVMYLFVEGQSMHSYQYATCYFYSFALQILAWIAFWRGL